jgi:hypothetical protein
MLKHTVLIVVCAMSVQSCSLAFAADSEAGFASLFNGRDLSSWEGQDDAWTVADGAIKCTGKKDGKRSWLIWRGGELADFELRLKFRFTSGNSGVQVRSKDEGDFQVRGYQVEIATAEFKDIRLKIK